MFGLGIWELVIVLVLIMIVFGVGKLPEVGTGLGKGIRNFKKAFHEENEKLLNESNSTEQKKDPS
ncbi:twin-arginine translocase TatA/TatE family subunit [candidate division CSSED10-310 bacterium]|uniref:Sec-independent protein translocase protein TatA n=1 Tax=candidate division CSSED10-310 bacterium TaxID=2855610 RepID=A0ABV6Z3L2_UNCC1